MIGSSLTPLLYESENYAQARSRAVGEQHGPQHDQKHGMAEWVGMRRLPHQKLACRRESRRKIPARPPETWPGR